MGDDKSNASGLKGSVDVVVSVERGNQTFEKLSLNVDGMEVASQDFGTAAAAEDAEQSVHMFTLSFDSDGYDSETGAVEYMNDEHSIQALLKVAGRDGALMSNIMLVEFNNMDGVYVALSGLGSGALNSETGQRWYGGPGAAAFAITALPVMYSGGSAASVGIEGFCGDDAATASPFVFTPECDGTADPMMGHTATFTADGAEIDVLNSDVFPLYLDYDGPAAPIFYPNPNGREGGWVNLTVDFGGEQGSKNEDGWLTFNDDDADEGVGGYQPVLKYAEDDDIEDARSAAPLSLANLPGESEENAYCAVVTAVDRLGNESDLPGDIDEGTCEEAGTAATYTELDAVDVAGTGYELLLQALYLANAMDDDAEGVTTKADAIADAYEELADAGLLVGVDITPPGIELVDDDTRFNDGDIAVDFDIFDDENEDANSGLHSSAPLLASAAIRDSDDANCLDITATGDVGTTDDDCDDPTALPDTPVDFGTDPANAYYTVRAASVDKAGNYSAPLSHTFVFDDEVATATAPAAPRIDAGETFEVASFLNDDLSIRDYYVTANFTLGGDNIRLGVVHPTAVDAFDADPLTNRNVPVSATVDTYTGLQENADANTDAVTTLTGVSVAVRDQADSDGTNDAPATATASFTVDDAGEVDDGFEDTFTIAFTSSDDVCVAEDMDDCEEGDDAERETELEFVATDQDLGAFSQPFDQVDFWVEDVNGASWLLGSDTSGESDRVSATDRNRTWTYSLDASAAMLYMLTREAGFLPTSDSDAHTVRAFAVNDDGIALVQEVSIDIDDGEDGN